MVKAYRLPLSWLMLTHNKRRMVTALAGVTFAVVLIFAQLGFLNALFDSQVELIQALNADVLMVSRAKSALPVGAPFPRIRLAQADAVEGVASAWPLYLGGADWKSDTVHRTRTIRIIAIDPDNPALTLPEVLEQSQQLKRPDFVLMDIKSKATFGAAAVGATAELNGKRVAVGGLFDLGTDFNADGTIVVGETAYRKLFGSGGDTVLSRVEIGLLKLEPGADAEAVMASLRRQLPDDVVFFTRKQFADRELEYWAQATATGPILELGAMLGFVVGVVICYQIMFTEVSDHIKQFATLKAIGFTDGSVTSVVIEEGLLLAGMGFLAGVSISWVLYDRLAILTGLPMEMTPARAGGVFVLTAAMCLISAFIAVRKVFSADPAEVF